MTTDASGPGVGAGLSQLNEKGSEHPIAFKSSMQKVIQPLINCIV